MICEKCSKEITGIGSAHSMVAVLQKVDTSNGYSYMQCEQGQTYAGANWQHFYCQPACLVAGLPACLSSHYEESSLVAIPTNQVRLHQTVFNAGLKCKVCQAALTSTAYRLCLTHATPVNSVPDDSLNDLGEWCCSLAHAQQSALAIVASIQEEK